MTQDPKQAASEAPATQAGPAKKVTRALELLARARQAAAAAPGSSPGSSAGTAPGATAAEPPSAPVPHQPVPLPEAAPIEPPPAASTPAPAPQVAPAPKPANFGFSGLAKALQRGVDVDDSEPPRGAQPTPPPRMAPPAAPPASTSRFGGVVQAAQYATSGRKKDTPVQRGPMPLRTGVADEAWPHDSTPAGSMFTPEEWAQTRKSEEVHAGGPVTLIEMRNLVEAWFIAIPKVRDPSTQKVRANGAKPAPLTEQEEARGLPPLIADVLDGCLLMSPNAPTSHPNSVTSIFPLDTREVALGVVKYRLVRPAEHTTDHRSLFMKMSFTEPVCFTMPLDAQGKQQTPAQMLAGQRAATSQQDQPTFEDLMKADEAEKAENDGPQPERMR